jgi:hypothetical protein
MSRSFDRKLDSGDGGERSRGAGSGSPLGYSTEVLGPRMGFPFRKGTNED